MDGDPILSQANICGVAETFVIWRVRMLLRIEASRGVVDSSIAELPLLVGHSADRDRYSGQALPERRVWYEHVE